MSNNNLILLNREEKALRLNKVITEMIAAGIDMLLIADNANKFYLTGRVFAGWLTLNTSGLLRAFVRRPIDLEGEEVTFVRKVEDVALDGNIIGLENATLSAAEYLRICAMLNNQSIVDASIVMRKSRAIKTDCEIALISESGLKQHRVYQRIPSLYRDNMTDIDLQIAIESELRKEGCLGQFRISGNSMELFMGNILVGDNADNPTPYDFAMGGAGTNPSLPVGANGSMITPGNSIMVDANGNFTGYMTDMTRTFALGQLCDEAMRAHACSIQICQHLAQIGIPGTKASTLYEEAARIAAEAELSQFFMGHRQQAGFVGHGVGIEINEAPVIAPRSKDILCIGQVIALEPKFVIPGAGAVGIENTYVVEENGMRCLTPTPEEILPL